MKLKSIALALAALIGILFFVVSAHRATGDFVPNQNVTMRSYTIGGKEYQAVVVTGTDGTPGVSLAGSQRAFASSPLTSGTVSVSGTFAAGQRSLELMVVTGTFQFVNTGTVTLTAGQGYSHTWSPDTSPAISYLLGISSTVSTITTQ